MNSRPRLCRLAVFVAVGWNAIVSMTTLVVAQVPGMPPGASGYTVSFGNAWVSSEHGYGPARITISTEPAVAVAREEVFSVSVRRGRYSSSPDRVSAPLVIPPGAKSASVDLYLPSDRSNDVYSCQLLVERGEGDGIMDRNDLLSADLNWINNGFSLLPTTLLISGECSDPGNRSWICYDGKVVDVGTTRNAYTSNQPLPSFDQLGLACQLNTNALVTGQTAAKPASPIVTLASNNRFHGVHPDFLPEKWLGYTGVDFILISFEDLSQICRQQPTDRSNLEKWTVAGGNLVVFNCDPSFEDADQILPLLLGFERSVVAERIPRQWKIPGDRGIRELTKLIRDATTQGYYFQSDKWYDSHEIETIKRKVGLESLEDLTSLATDAERPRFAISDYLNGRIIAVPGDMSDWKEADWRTILNSVSVDGGSLHHRIGGPVGSNGRPHFNIPGVGQPPVKMFQILIGLFLLMAGPVMLLLLRRTGQMQYLFVAVPGLSLAVCCTLLSYAILVDGSKKWGRTQTVTRIDHRTNMSVTHTRATYYTGGRPGPYEFTDDTLAKTSMGQSSAPLDDRYGDGVHRLSGAEIRPRNPHEVVTMRSQAAKQRLILIQATEKDGTPIIENQLGTDVQLVVFRTDRGVFAVRNLKNKKSAESESVTPAVAKSMVQQFAREALRSDDAAANEWNFNRAEYRQNFGEEIRVVNLLSGSNADQLYESNNSYVALLKTFPLAAGQLQPVQYKQELHVVRGQW